MKNMWMAACLTAALALGSPAMAAQPGLAENADGIRTMEAAYPLLDAKYPVLDGGSALRRARVNAAVETEVARFYRSLEKQNETAPVSGWVTCLAGRSDKDYVSLVLLETVMPKGAAHPSTVVKGLTFDGKGRRVTRGEALAMIPAESGPAIDARVRKEAEAREIHLFPEARAYRWPDEFFFGADGHLRFLFQQYDIAPYAAGWIAIDAGALPAVDPVSHP